MLTVANMSSIAAIPSYVIYVLLCGVAIWSTFQNSATPRKWMRVPLTAMLIVLTFIFVLNIINFSPTSGLRIDILHIALNMATCLAGVLSDGLLAWRCFVLFGKRPWAKWLCVVSITLNLGVGTLSNLMVGTMSDDDQSGIQLFLDAWAFIFLIINSSMTFSIIFKIISSANRAKGLGGSQSVYNTVIRAIIESSLISWMGLLTYALSSEFYLSLEGHKSTSLANATYSISFTILPFIFGISQTLIIARVGFSRMRASSPAAKRTALVFGSDHQVVEEGEEPVDSVGLESNKGRGDIEMSTARSST